MTSHSHSHGTRGPNRNQQVDALPPGYRLSEYELIELVAKDGQAHVYIARVWQERQPSLGWLGWRLRWQGTSPALIQQQRLCIIKVAQPGWGDSLRDEYGYLSNHKHLRLVRLFRPPRDNTVAHRRERQTLPEVTMRESGGEMVSLPYLALHYEPGGSLKALLERRKGRRLRPAVAVQIALQVAEVLEYLHTSPEQLVHHDISPSNILFRRPLSALRSQPPDCVLIDMAAADSPVKPRLRKIYGKRMYLPPERLTSPPQPLDGKIDVYGLGVTLYEMLAGKLPRPSTTTTGEAARRLPHIREFAPDISEPLSSLVMMAVSHEPQRRPTMGALRERLQAVPEAARPARLRGTWNRRSIAGVAGSALAALLLVAALAVGLPFPPSLSMAEPPPATKLAEPTITPLPLPTAPPTPTPTAVPTSTPALAAPASQP